MEKNFRYIFYEDRSGRAGNGCYNLWNGNQELRVTKREIGVATDISTARGLNISHKYLKS